MVTLQYPNALGLKRKYAYNIAISMLHHHSIPIHSNPFHRALLSTPLPINRKRPQLLEPDHRQCLLMRRPQMHLGHDALARCITLLLRMQQSLPPASSTQTPSTARGQPYGAEIIPTRGAVVKEGVGERCFGREMVALVMIGGILRFWDGYTYIYVYMYICMYGVENKTLNGGCGRVRGGVGGRTYQL